MLSQGLGGDGSRRVVVLHGLGGIGRTQLSIAYIKRHKDNYSVIFWLKIKDVLKCYPHISTNFKAMFNTATDS
jgi:MinD superfamily P-loop ATPase